MSKETKPTTLVETLLKKIEDPLKDAVKNMSTLSDDDKVNIRGKYYAEVHVRVQAFREAYGERGKIISTIHQADETKVMTETVISVFVDGSWRQLANDFAEEFRGAGMVNKTSAVENCLTSSIGRSLAACGLSGGSYASFEEVDHAINEKAEAPNPEPSKKKKSKKAEKKTDQSDFKKEILVTEVSDSNIVTGNGKEVIQVLTKDGKVFDEAWASKFLEDYSEISDGILTDGTDDEAMKKFRSLYRAEKDNIDIMGKQFPELKIEFDKALEKNLNRFPDEVRGTSK